MTNAQKAAVLELRGVTKSYPGVRALADIDFDVLPGEVHGVVGENGAGKSTLIKIIGGVVRPDAGQVFIDGTPVEMRIPADARAHGISVIHQELEVIPNLSVTENVLLGCLPTGPRGIVNDRLADRQTAEVLELVGLPFAPQTKVHRLNLAERRLVVIARALAIRSRILVMDEPTAALTETEAARLGDLIQRLRAAGTSIVYVSHRVSEVIALSNRVTVMRDGRAVETVSAEGASVDGLVRSMVGRDLAQLYPRRRSHTGAIALELIDLTGDGFAGIDLTVRQGEIIALYGLLGSGCPNVSRAIFGAPPPTRGRVILHGEATSIRRPIDARKAGIGLLPIERREEGLVLPLDVTMNVALASIPRFGSYGVFKDADARRRAEHWTRTLSIRTRSIDTQVSTLSGGNQQKVIFARWLEAQSRILVLEEPTRGVDVGAKAEIYRLIDDLCEQGVAVVLVSSEIEEVLAISDRIVVMSRGRISGQFFSADATKELVMTHAAA